MRDGRHLVLAPLPRVRPAAPTRLTRRAGACTLLLIAVAAVAATTVRWSGDTSHPQRGEREPIEFTSSRLHLRLPPVEVTPPASTAARPPDAHPRPLDLPLAATPTLRLPPPDMDSMPPPRRIAVTDATADSESLPRLQPRPRRPHRQSAPQAPAVTAPVPLRQTPPIYPALARRRGWEGTCTLTVHIDKKGHVTAAHVRSSSGHRVLDAAALRTIRQWTFRPGMVDLLPTTSKADVPVVFSLQ